MLKSVHLKKDPQSEDLYFDLAELQDFLDISQIETCRCTLLADDALLLEFFDKDGQTVKPN